MENLEEKKDSKKAKAKAFWMEKGFIHGIISAIGIGLVAWGIYEFFIKEGKK